MPKVKRNTVYSRAPHHDFKDDIRTLTMLANLPMPKEMDVVKERIEDFRRLQDPCTVALVRAVIDGDDVAVLRAAALAEMAAPPDSRLRSDLTAIVADAAYRGVVDTYGTVAAEHFATLAAEFNTTATAFARAADTVDPERDAVEMVSAPEKQRTAWQQAAEHAQKLDALLSCLVASARLNGIDILDTAESLTLVCDPTGHHRRRVHEAWELGGQRCGRWSALHRLGVPLRVAGLDAWEPYAEPAPIATRRVNVDGRWVDEVFDPEDEQLSAEQEYADA